MLTSQSLFIKGGEFLIQETQASDIFTPEDLTEEQNMIAQQCHDFLTKEVYPKLDEIDAMKDETLLPSILDKAGQLGLLATSIPSELGGFGMDFNTTMLVAEIIGRGHSVAVAFSAHTGIGTLPILYYGNEEQRKKYVPKLATGEWKVSYCLTEPDAGSDANSGKTSAKLSADKKHYVINGQKIWITNAGFADVFIVFAKIDGDKNLTAFIVEKSFGGITMNEEERKMGIKGSSTRQIFFNDCKVPVENQLSTRENGFKIAVNILNIGRIKLGISAVGGSKSCLEKVITYAKERKQFGVSISTFGAIQHKLAQMAVSIYGSESAHYRASQNIDDAYKIFIDKGVNAGEARLKSLEEYAIECAILKIHGSETLDLLVDEGVQIYGGMGFSADGPMDRAYRDSRINRIFEGTNEINRLLIVDMLLKRAMKGTIDLMAPAAAIQKELLSVPEPQTVQEGGFSEEKKIIANLKKATLMVAGAAVQKLMTKISDEQELLMDISNMIIEIYVAESAILRAEKISLSTDDNKKQASLFADMARTYLYQGAEKVASCGRSAITSFAEGDTLRLLLMGHKRFTKIPPVNLKKIRRQIVQVILEQGKY